MGIGSEHVDKIVKWFSTFLPVNEEELARWLQNWVPVSRFRDSSA